MPFEAHVPNIQLHSGETIRVQEVFKFGGSSLATAPRIIAAVTATLAENNVSSVVVSANGDNTDHLIQLCDQKQTSRNNALTLLENIIEQQTLLAEQCIKAPQFDTYIEHLRQDQQNISEWLNGNNDRLTRADIIAYGEVWSAKLFSLTIASISSMDPKLRSTTAQWIDAREFLRFNKSGFCHSTSFAKLNVKLQEQSTQSPNRINIITGFVATDHLGNTILLGRNGSDYSASLIASLLDAKKVTFWTDVDGVYSADPNCVPEAKRRDELCYQNAFVLSQLGSPVLHHRTLSPLESNSIDLTIRRLHPATSSDIANEVSEKKFGSSISHKELNSNEDWIVHVKKDLALVEMETVPEHYPILLHFENNNSHAGSNNSLDIFSSLALIDPELEQLNLNEKYAKQNKVSLISVITNQSLQLLNWFSDFFKQLNITPVQLLTMPNALVALVSDQDFKSSQSPVDKDNVEASLHRALNNRSAKAFVGLIGPGQVGSEVLNLVTKLAPSAELVNNCRFIQVANSKRQVTLSQLSNWSNELNENQGLVSSTLADLIEFSAYLKKQKYQDSVHTIIIDTTGSEKVATHYEQFFNDGHHVITANKIAGSSHSDNYQLLKSSARQNQVQWLYESTVGAGLPIIQTIKNLIQSSDRIREIQTVCSGSLAFIFNQYSQGVPFSDAISQAKQKGFTEPDPRLDLSGVDIARNSLFGA